MLCLGPERASSSSGPEEIGDFELPSIQDGKHAGVIAVGGLLLAKIPLETRNERNAYYQSRSKLCAQMQLIMIY